MQNNCVKRSRLTVVLRKRDSGRNNDNDVLLRKYLEAPGIKLDDTKSLLRGSIISRLPKRREKMVVLDHHLDNCNVSHVGQSRLGI